MGDVLATAVIKVNPGGEEAVQQLLAEGNRLRDFAIARVIATAEDVVSVTNDLSLLAKLRKSLVMKQKEYAGPINEHLKAVNDVFKTVAAPFEEADQITRDKMKAYNAAQDRKRREVAEINRLRLEALQREAALNQGEIKESLVVLDVPPPQPAHVRTDVGTMGQSVNWKCQVVDFKLLPDEYKMADEVKIGKVVRTTKGTVVIAGVKIWSEPGIRVTTR